MSGLEGALVSRIEDGRRIELDKSWDDWEEPLFERKGLSPGSRGRDVSELDA